MLFFNKCDTNSHLYPFKCFRCVHYVVTPIHRLLNLHLQTSVHFCEGFHETSCHSLTLLLTGTLHFHLSLRCVTLCDGHTAKACLRCGAQEKSFHYRTPCSHAQMEASIHTFATFQPIKTKPQLAVSCILIHWAGATARLANLVAEKGAKSYNGHLNCCLFIASRIFITMLDSGRKNRRRFS